MPKTKISDYDKELLVRMYQRGNHTLKELGVKFAISTRTVGRILDAAQVASPVSRARGELHQIKKVLNKHRIEINELDLALTGAVNMRRVIPYLAKCTDAKLTYLLDQVNQARQQTVNTSVTTQDPA